MEGGGGGVGGIELAYNLMLRGHRSKLSSRSCSNVVEAFQHSCLDFFQLPAGIAVLHIGDSDPQSVCVIVQVELLQRLQGKVSTSWKANEWCCVGVRKLSTKVVTVLAAARMVLCIVGDSSDAASRQARSCWCC